MPGFTEHERAALAKAFKEAGADGSALPDSRAVIPFTKGARQALLHSLLAAIELTIQAAKAYSKKLDDAQADRLMRLERRVLELEKKAS
jgi:hypothetical protein